MLGEREVADVLGDLCDGLDVSPAERELALVALSGVVQTADIGQRLYYVEVDTLLLENTDTAEAIWSVPADGVLRLPNGDKLIDLADMNAIVQQRCFVLTLMCDSANFERLEKLWLADTQAQPVWKVLMTRIIEPLRKWLK